MLFTSPAPADRDRRKPFRDEPLSSERFDERAPHARRHYTFDPQRAPCAKIYPRLRDNERELDARLSHPRLGCPRRRVHHARNRVVPRQLPLNLVGAGSKCGKNMPRRYYRELPVVVDAPAGRRHACLRNGRRVAPAHRQPARSAATDAVPEQLSTRGAADARRAVGVAEHVEGRADRKRAPPCRRNPRQPRRPPPRRRRRRDSSMPGRWMRRSPSPGMRTTRT